MNLNSAYSELSRQIKEMVEAGSDARPVSLDVHKDEAGHHVLVEFSDSNLIGVTFADDEPYTPERREALEAGFAVTIGITLAMVEAA